MSTEKLPGQESALPLHNQNARFPTIPLLEQTQVLFERDGGLTECFVPSELIDHEEVPVKEEWAASLAKQMHTVSVTQGGTGQKTAIRLGWIEGESVFRIVDGFHRDAALVMNEEPLIYATVEKTDWNTLYDARIFTAKDHAHVRFSRVVKWIQEVWQYSGLEDKLKVEQAILLYRYDGNGTKLHLTSEEVEAAKEWVAKKEELWGMQAMTIHSHLQTAGQVDPSLVNATREKKKSHVLEAPTQQIIKTFSDYLPDDFDLQNLVWKSAKQHNLSAPQVKALCDKVKDKKFDEAQKILAATDVATIEPVYAETKTKQLRRASDPRHKGAAVLSAAVLEIERVNQRVTHSLERGEEVTPDMQANLTETLSKLKEVQAAIGALSVNLVKLREKNTSQTAPLPTSEVVLKAYKHHLSETERNIKREPLPRNRTSIIKMELPDYGRFTGEDWFVLEPHHRLALALSHDSIINASFKQPSDAYRQAAEIAGIKPDFGGSLHTPADLANTLRPLLVHLVKYLPFGKVIELDKSSNKPTITPAGKKYLAQVVKNALISVDDSREQV